MERKNLYFAQMGEAISLANHEIFEYKRISLILFDNIVENLLKSNIISRLRYMLVMGELDKSDYRNIINNLHWFDNIVTQARRLEIISQGEASIINYCHISRNNLYHKLFENEKVTEYCILFYSIFLESNLFYFIETGITGYSEKSEKSSEIIKKKESIIDFEELTQKLNVYISTSSTIPQRILSEILLNYVVTIEDFYESEAKEEWSALNKIVKNQYFHEVKNQKNEGLNDRSIIPKLRKKWFDVNEEKLKNLKQDIQKSEKYDIELSFIKFRTISEKLEPIYIGIMLYYSMQEY